MNSSLRIVILSFIVAFIESQDVANADIDEFQEYIASLDGLMCVNIKKRKFYPIRAVDKACTKLKINIVF